MTKITNKQLKKLTGLQDDKELKCKLLEPYIHVKLVERKRKSGIIIASDTNKDYNDIEVVDTYKDCKTCKKGDKIILDPSTGTIRYEVDNIKSIFVDESGIVAIY